MQAWSVWKVISARVEPASMGVKPWRLEGRAGAARVRVRERRVVRRVGVCMFADGDELVGEVWGEDEDITWEDG